MNQMFKKIYTEHDEKIMILEKERNKINEETRKKCVTAAVIMILKNPEFKEHFNITPISYAINVFGFNFDPRKSSHHWSEYIQKCPYYIGHPLFEEAVPFPDYLREQALYSDVTSIKYIKNPTKRHLKIVACLAPDLLGYYTIDQELQDFIIDNNPENIRFVSNPTIKSAIKLLKISPCYIIYLPAAMKNYPEVLRTFVLEHFTIFKSTKSLRAFKCVENLEIDERILRCLSKLEKKCKENNNNFTQTNKID